MSRRIHAPNFMKKSYLLLSGIIFLLTSQVSQAQYWSRWQKTHNVTVGISSDDKWAFFIKKEASGAENIYKVDLKTTTVTPVTNFVDGHIERAIVLFGKPSIVYARAVSSKGDDVHLFRINTLTNDAPLDLTPGEGTTSKKIIGLSYNGRYVYYTSDKGPNTKTDTYRYDTQQYILELALANDKDYQTLCWSRDQTHLLIRDPKSSEILNYSIESTNRDKIDIAAAFPEVKTLFYDPMNTKYYFIGNERTLLSCKIGAANPTENEAILSTEKIDQINLSLNGKYLHVITGEEEKVVDKTTSQALQLPNGAFDLMVSPKETSVLYVAIDATGMKFFVYDIVKKTSKELATFK